MSRPPSKDASAVGALTKGQAVISGVGVNTPVMCRVRARLTRHGGETFDAPQEWADWHSTREREHRAQDNALLVKEEKKAEKIRGIRICKPQSSFNFIQQSR